jgi:hypothetical protein
MSRIRGDQRLNHEVTAGEVFALLWNAMADILGTGATATLLRRAIRKVAERRPDLKGLTIRKEALKYAFTIPDSWNEPQTTAMDALRDVTQALRPMLAELTGRVVLRQLEKLELLKEHRIMTEE